MRVIFLVLFALSGWGYAADGAEFNLLESINESDALIFAKAICEVEQECHYGEDDVPWGPVFVQFSRGYFWPYEVVYGKFSQNQIPEAFVHLLQSDTEFAGRGGLFRYQNNAWKYIGMSDAPRGHCEKIVDDLGVDHLVCYSDAQTRITDPFLYEGLDGSGFVMYVFDLQEDIIKQSKLISFSNSFSVFCDQRAQFLPAPYYEVVEFSLTDAGLNTYVDLKLEISQTQFDTKHCYDRETGLLQQANDAVLHQLTWLFDGETFTPTPETRAFLDSLHNQ
jgi:hypothetical protein